MGDATSSCLPAWPTCDVTIVTPASITARLARDVTVVTPATTAVSLAVTTNTALTAHQAGVNEMRVGGTVESSGLSTSYTVTPSTSVPSCASFRKRSSSIVSADSRIRFVDDTAALDDPVAHHQPD